MVAVDHPLSGRVLRARRVYRQWGRVWLVLELPGRGVVSVEAGDTDVLGAEPVVTAPSGMSTLSSEGGRRLLELLRVCMERSAGDPGRRPVGEGRAR